MVKIANLRVNVCYALVRSQKYHLYVEIQADGLQVAQGGIVHMGSRKKSYF